MLRFIDFGITHSQNDEGIESGKSELLEVQAERRKNQRLLDGLYESLIAGDITDDEYKEIKTAYTSKISDLAADEKLLRQAERKRTKQNTMLSRASESLIAARSGNGLTAEIADGIIEKIRVFSDRSIRVKFTFMDREIPSREVADYE
jgi:hypothetical protein